MIRYAKALVVAAALFTLTACGGVNLSGNWTGTGQAPGGFIQFSMLLTQADTTVSGNVNFLSGLTGSAQVNGTLSGNTVFLSSGGLQMNGTVSGSTLTGNGSATVQDQNGQTSNVTFTFTAEKQ